MRNDSLTLLKEVEKLREKLIKAKKENLSESRVLNISKNLDKLIIKTMTKK